MRASLALAALLIGLISWVGWRYVYVPRAVHARAVEESSLALVETLAELDQDWRSAEGDGGPSPAENERRRFLTEEQVRGLFEVPERRFVYDPATFFRYQPDLWERMELPEHPDGHWIFETGPAGLRESAHAPASDREFLVLCVGDAQAAGVCNAGESFPGLLQTMLEKRHRWRRCDVWNSAVSGYTFQNYVAAIESQVGLEPDVVVVTLNGADDFMEAARVDHALVGEELSAQPYGRWDKIASSHGFLSQPESRALHQAVYFQYYPEHAELGLRIALGALTEIRELCQREGFALIVLYVPPGFDPDADTDLSRRLSRRAVELSDHDLHLYDRLADKLLGALGDLDVEVIDLREDFGEERDLYFWNELDLGLEGHRAIAERLLPRVEEVWGVAE